MPADGKKGITVKVDAVLHAEVKQYLEDHDMTMAEFVALALTDELHPKTSMKEEKNMGNMRTLAFQVPEDLFLRIKGYLQRNNMTQKDFVIGLIETELEREQAVCEGMADALTEQEEQEGEAAEHEEATYESNSETVLEESGEQGEAVPGEGFENNLAEEEPENEEESEECMESEDGEELEDCSAEDESEDYLEVEDEDESEEYAEDENEDNTETEDESEVEEMGFSMGM